MCFLQHEFVLSLKPATTIAGFVSGKDRQPLEKRKTVTSTLCQVGDPTFTAMAKTVGLPPAIVAKLLLFDGLLEKNADLRGVQVPLKRALYAPILDALWDRGIRFKHHVVEHQNPSTK